MDSVRPTWIVTGASSGIGKALALQAARFANVIAIGRNKEALQMAENSGCRSVILDINDSEEELGAAVAAIVEREGSVDVLINAAGYILEGSVEEASDQETLSVFNTHVFGPLRLIRALLPHMRHAGKGVIINIAGIGAFSGSPNAGVYCASKAAMSTLTEALQREVSSFGIRVSLVQLGHFRTSFLRPGHRIKVASYVANYDQVLEPFRSTFNAFDGAQPGDAEKAATIIIGLVQGDPHAVPFLLALGSDVPAAELRAHDMRVQEMTKYAKLTNAADIAQS